MVEAKHDGGRLTIRVAGCGAAGPGQELEAGLVDVADRVGALGGQCRVERIQGSAVTIWGEIPCGS